MTTSRTTLVTTLILLASGIVSAATLSTPPLGPPAGAIGRGRCDAANVGTEPVDVTVEIFGGAVRGQPEAANAGGGTTAIGSSPSLASASCVALANGQICETFLDHSTPIYCTVTVSGGGASNVRGSLTLTAGTTMTAVAATNASTLTAKARRRR